MITSLEKETHYQNIMRRGFRIIRPGINPYRIESKNMGKRGWQRIEKFETHEKMVNRLIELGREEKTLIYNE